MNKLIGLVGTNSDHSTNRMLLQYIQKHFSDKADIEIVEIKDLPIFDKPADMQIPAEAKALAEKIEKQLTASSSAHQNTITQFLLP